VLGFDNTVNVFFKSKPRLQKQTNKQIKFKIKAKIKKLHKHISKHVQCGLFLPLSCYFVLLYSLCTQFSLLYGCCIQFSLNIIPPLQVVWSIKGSMHGRFWPP
jgi:hypothetical protein